MKRFFSKFGIWLLAGIAIIVVVLSIISAASSGTGILRNIAGVIASPFRSAGSAIAGWVEDVGGRFSDNDELRQENDELRRQVADLEEQLRQAEADTQENARLRELLKLQTKRSDLTFASAKVTQSSGSNWASTLTLGAGTHSDIAIGDCVVDEYGCLVGVITDAGMNWSTVTTVLDTGFSVGAKVFRTEDIAVAAGELHLMQEGLLSLTYLPASAELINGDLIVTSGLGGYVPADLVVGSVRELRADDGGLQQYAVLKPGADLMSLRQVFVVTAFDTQG